jgi:hypothetical protein
VDLATSELDEINFLVNEAEEIEDVWIEDLRTFPHRIRLQGKEIPPGARIEDFEALFGDTAETAA